MQVFCCFLFQHVGCDHRLDSNKRMDTCGVCGGNDTCIHGNRGNAGRYRWIETGFGSCSVTCGVGNSVFISFVYLNFKCGKAVTLTKIIHTLARYKPKSSNGLSFINYLI